MPVLTSTGSWQLTECVHCKELIAVKSDDPADAIKLLKQHWKESKFCGRRQALIDASPPWQKVESDNSTLKNNIINFSET